MILVLSIPCIVIFIGGVSSLHYEEFDCGLTKVMLFDQQSRNVTVYQTRIRVAKTVLKKSISENIGRLISANIEVSINEVRNQSNSEVYVPIRDWCYYDARVYQEKQVTVYKLEVIVTPQNKCQRIPVFLDEQLVKKIRKCFAFHLTTPVSSGAAAKTYETPSCEHVFSLLAPQEFHIDVRTSLMAVEDSLYVTARKIFVENLLPLKDLLLMPDLNWEYGGIKLEAVDGTIGDIGINLQEDLHSKRFPKKCQCSVTLQSSSIYITWETFKIHRGNELTYGENLVLELKNITVLVRMDFVVDEFPCNVRINLMIPRGCIELSDKSDVNSEVKALINQYLPSVKVNFFQNLSQALMKSLEYAMLEKSCDATAIRSAFRGEI